MGWQVIEKAHIVQCLTTATARGFTALVRPSVDTMADQALIEGVLLAVECVPAGRVVSYGDLGELCGTSARRVGSILRDHGGGVPWWRVTNSYGDHPLLARARPYWEAEGIAVKPNGLGCRISAYRADLMHLADDWEQRQAPTETTTAPQ